MALVRLQCPACSAIVKVGEEIVAQHPIVRCAQCQGLVTVATSRIAEAPVAEKADDDDFDPGFKPKKKKLKRQQTELPIGMILGAIFGFIGLIGIGFAVYFLIDAFSASGPEKVLKKAVAILNRVVDTIEEINTPEDVARLQPKLAELEKESKDLAEQMRQVQPSMTPELNNRLQEKYGPQLMELQGRLLSLIMKKHQNPQLAEALRNRAGGAAFGLGGFVGGGGMNMPDQGFQPPGNIPNNLGRNQGSNPASSPNNTLTQLESTLLAQSTLASSIPDLLNHIKDSDDAVHASFSIDNMVPTLKSQSQSIKQYERKLDSDRVQRDTQVVRDAQRDLKKSIDEIRLHLDRIGKIPELRLHHIRLTRLLGEAGLYDGSAATVASDTGKPESSGDNPFQPADSNAKSNTTKPGDSNPFEAVPSGGNKKTADNTGMNPELDSTIGKLTSVDHFRKAEGLREIATAKVDESRKKEVLEALVALFEDSGIHQKGDVLKVFKKWATTQEDKERLGQCAESMLKDPWLKKDALRYLGENKVITSSKDVARVLKDTFDRKEAAEALIAMGSEAEKNVIPYLNDLDPQVRHMAIEVLARIGTRACVPDLQRLQSDRAVGLAAKQAIQLINGRKK